MAGYGWAYVCHAMAQFGWKYGHGWAWLDMVGPGWTDLAVSWQCVAMSWLTMVVYGLVYACHSIAGCGWTHGHGWALLDRPCRLAMSWLTMVGPFWLAMDPQTWPADHGWLTMVGPGSLAVYG